MEKRFKALLGIALLALGCSLTASAKGEDKLILRAALYEFIPGYEDDKLAALRKELKDRFDLAHPDIDLQLEATSDRGKLYDLGTIEGWLTKRSGEHFHVIEIDTLLLGDLAESEAILPIGSTDTSDFFEVGLHSTKVNGQLLGVPHLLCGYFLFSRDPKLLEGSGQKELLSVLRSDSDDAVDLVGEFNGSWTLPALYLDAWLDAHPQGDVAAAFNVARNALDPDVAAALTDMIGLCEVNGENTCVSGSYWNAGGPQALVQAFALGHADALIGYSERLHWIRKIMPKGFIGVRSAPLGEGDNPIMFSDAFVIGKNCDARCREAAMSFVKFMNSESTMAYYLLAKDRGPNSVPRYLMPATRSAFTIPEVAQDPLYAGFKKHIERASPFPNTGFVEHRKDVQKNIKCAIRAGPC